MSKQSADSLYDKLPIDEDVRAYAPRLVLTRHTGILFAWTQQDYTYFGEPDSLKQFLESITIKNLLFGWWSPRSIIINPIVILTNWRNFVSYKKKYKQFLMQPAAYIAKAKKDAIINAEREKRRTKRALIMLGVLVAIFIVITLVALLIES